MTDLPQNGAAGAVQAFLTVIRRLRGPGGCPWDAQQTPNTLKTYFLEEAYELVEAIELQDPVKVREELGRRPVACGHDQRDLSGTMGSLILRR